MTAALLGIQAYQYGLMLHCKGIKKSIKDAKRWNFGECTKRLGPFNFS